MPSGSGTGIPSSGFVAPSALRIQLTFPAGPRLQSFAFHASPDGLPFYVALVLEFGIRPLKLLFCFTLSSWRACAEGLLPLVPGQSFSSCSAIPLYGVPRDVVAWLYGMSLVAGAVPLDAVAETVRSFSVPKNPLDSVVDL